MNIFSGIGNTPLVRVKRPYLAVISAKLEYLNPGGSIKDRSALYLVQKAEQEGLLSPESVIVDASSGNHGIALSMIGSAKGYRVIITTTEKISQEKLQTIRSYGADVVVCPVATKDGKTDYHKEAVALAQSMPHAYMPNQYFSQDNARAHYQSLGPEIWQQTDGKITHFFAAAGTGGTVTGVGQFLKERNPTIQVIAVDSVNSYRATGGNPKPYIVEGMGIDFDSPVIDYSVIDEIITVSDHEAITALQQLACSGFLVGPSSGAVMCAVEKYQDKLCPDSVVVMIFGDSGRAYLSKGFYSIDAR